MFNGGWGISYLGQIYGGYGIVNYVLPVNNEIDICVDALRIIVSTNSSDKPNVYLYKYSGKPTLTVANSEIIGLNNK